MDQKAPLEIDLQLLKNKNLVRNNEYRFINSELGFVISLTKVQSDFLRFGQPYRIQEGRVTFVTKGSARILINLIEYQFQVNTLSLIAPGSIVQIIDVSPDFDAQMMAVNQNFLPISGKEEFFTYFLQRKRNVMLTMTQAERKQIEDFMTIIWNTLQEPAFRREVVQHLIAALLYNIEYITKSNQQEANNHLTHQEDIFQRFISLVNAHSKTQRNVTFYADKLCLTPRYLNTVIRQTSQQTVMDWINQSIILEAKVQLKHTNRLVYQISDELNFPNPSFFCKFFKRMTGMTPQEYQKSK